MTLGSRITSMALCLGVIFAGGHAVVTRHLETTRHGIDYSVDGKPALVTGVIMCVSGVMGFLAMIFAKSDFLNRPLFGPKQNS